MVIIFDSMSFQPRDGTIVFVQNRFKQDRVVGAAIKRDACATIRCHFDNTAGLDELVRQLFQFLLFESLQLARHPSVTAISDHRERHIQIDVETNLTRQVVHLKEVYVRDHFAWRRIRVIGQKLSRPFAPQTGHGNLPYRSLITIKRETLFQVRNPFSTTLGNVNHGGRPVCLRSSTQL